MTNNMFHSLIRDYASLAQRKRKSYADAVTAVLQLRLAQIAKEVSDPAEAGRQQQAAFKAVEREYGTVDSTWEASYSN